MSQGPSSPIADPFGARESPAGSPRPVPSPPHSNAFATLALVFGVAALAVAWIPVVSLVAGAPLAIGAVLCGLTGELRGLRRRVGLVRARVGLALGLAALILELMTFLLSL